MSEIDVSKCIYAITPSKQSPQKAMYYAKKTSCIACKEHNTKLNFCDNNPNCYYKQLQKLKQENEYLKECAETNASIRLTNFYETKIDKITLAYEKKLEKIRENALAISNYYQFKDKNIYQDWINILQIIKGEECE